LAVESTPLCVSNKCGKCNYATHPGKEEQPARRGVRGHSQATACLRCGLPCLGLCLVSHAREPVLVPSTCISHIPLQHRNTGRTSKRHTDAPLTPTPTLPSQQPPLPASSLLLPATTSTHTRHVQLLHASHCHACTTSTTIGTSGHQQRWGTEEKNSHCIIRDGRRGERHGIGVAVGLMNR
jgi:hypothetical protein